MASHLVVWAVAGSHQRVDQGHLRVQPPAPEGEFATAQAFFKAFQRQDPVMSEICIAAVVVCIIAALAFSGWTGFFVYKKSQEPTRDERKKMLQDALKRLLDEEPDSDDDDLPVDPDMGLAEHAKELAEKGARYVTPLIRKHDRVRKALQKRLEHLQSGSRDFLGRELKEVSRDLFKVLDMSDAKELFAVDDKAAEKSAAMPPVSVVVAGLFAPMSMYTFRCTNLLLLVVLVITLIGFLVATVWDFVEGLTCSIAGMYLWAWIMIGLLSTAVLVRTILCIKTESALSTISGLAKAQEENLGDTRKRHEAGALTPVEELLYMKDLLVANVTLSSRALVLWDDISSSWLSVVVLLLAIALMIGGFWGAYLMVETFTMEAAGTPCAAFRLAMLVRIFTILFAVCLMLILASICLGCVSLAAQNRTVGFGIIRFASKMDQENAAGLPVVTTLAKSFVVRDEEDLLRLRLTEREFEEAQLLERKKKLAEEKERHEARVKDVEATLAELQAKQDALSTEGGVEARMQQFKDECDQGLGEMLRAIDSVELEEAEVKESPFADLHNALDDASGGLLKEWEAKAAEAKVAADKAAAEAQKEIERRAAEAQKEIEKQAAAAQEFAQSQVAAFEAANPEASAAVREAVASASESLTSLGDTAAQQLAAARSAKGTEAGIQALKEARAAAEQQLAEAARVGGEQGDQAKKQAQSLLKQIKKMEK